MNKISLSTVLYALLAAFAVEHINKYVTTTQVFLDNSRFYLIVFLVFISLLFFDIKRKENKPYFWPKLIIISLSILIIILTAVVPRMELRRITESEYNLNDSGAKTLSASNLLIRGINPYSADYSSTPYGRKFANVYSEKYKGELNHYVYLPFFLVTNTLTQIITYKYWGFADPVMILVIAYFCTLIFLYLIPQEKEKKLILLVIAGLNPFLISTFIHGQNDIFTFVLMLGSFILLSKNKHAWSLILLGLACASKQYAWLLVPFYFFYFYFMDEEKRVLKKIIFATKKLLVALIPFLIFIGPFIFWSAGDLFADTVLFCTGGMETSFPVSGTGLGGLLAKIGIIKRVEGFSITYLLQAAIGLPLFIWLIKKMKKKNSIANLIAYYTLFSFCLLVSGRFFNEQFFPLFSLLITAAWAFSNNNDILKKT